MKKLSVVVIVVLLAVGAGFAYFKLSGDRKNDGPRTVTVEKGGLLEKALAIGEIVPRHQVAVKAKISGIVAHIFVAEGDYVQPGDRLIEVRPDPTPLEYAQAKRTLELRLLAEEQRQADLARIAGLLERGLTATVDYERANEQYAQAVLQRQMAEEQLAIVDLGRAVVAGRTVENIIVSPIASHVLELKADVGAPVVPLTAYQPGTELMTLADMGDLLFKGTVDEIDIGKIHEGMAVEIKVGAFPDQIVRGVLARIALKSQKRDNATVFAVEIDRFELVEGMMLRAGYSANAD